MDLAMTEPATAPTTPAYPQKIVLEKDKREIPLAQWNLLDLFTEAGLNPTKDALVIEGSDSPYVNILVVSSARKDDASLQKLAKALNSTEVKAFINDKYKGAVVPAF